MRMNESNQYMMNVISDHLLKLAPKPVTASSSSSSGGGIDDVKATPLAKTYEQYYMERMNLQQWKYKTGIEYAVTTPVEKGLTFAPLPKGELQTILHLAVPKQVVEGDYESSTAAATTKRQKQPRQGNKRGPKPNKFFKNLSGVAADASSASIYAEEEARLQERRAGGGGGGNDSDGGDGEYEMDNIEDLREQIPMARLPTNFTVVAKELFEYFWNLEFDDAGTNFAFFAKITALNCKEYNLQDFSGESSCLTVIKERLDGDAYISTEYFYYDFVQLFDNIFKYFPEDSEAYKTAKEVSATFDERWKAAQQKFIY